MGMILVGAIAPDARAQRQGRPLRFTPPPFAMRPTAHVAFQQGICTKRPWSVHWSVGGRSGHSTPRGARLRRLTGARAVVASRGMKPLLFVASVLLGVSGLTQVVPDADRLAQRRVVPRRIARAAARRVPRPRRSGW